MPDQVRLIVGALEQLADRLKNQECWVTFEANQGEHWLQSTRDQINMDWPFAQPPTEEQLQRYFSTVAPFELIAWDKDLYATVNITAADAATLADVVHRIFLNLYDLGAEYVLTCKLEDA